MRSSNSIFRKLLAMNAKTTTITMLEERNGVGKEHHPRDQLFSTREVKLHQYSAVKPDIVFKAFQPIMYLAQCIGILPVYGISGVNSDRLRFIWFSARSFLSIVMVILGFILLVFTTANKGINGKTAGTVVFYFVTTLSMIFYIQLAREWKELIVHWKRVIDVMDIDGREIIKTTKMITITMITLSLSEHLLANINSYFMHKNDKNDTVNEFLRKKFNAIFHVTGYSFWKGIIALAIHFQNTIVWNFTDIFLMNVATIMSLLFKYFNNSIKEIIIKQDKTMVCWKLKRETYCQLSYLMKTIDNKISNIVLLSFGSNLFFICKQLYHSLMPTDSLVKNIYFYLSFGFLLIRTCGVCFTAANIYEFSKKPLQTMYTIPSEQYNIEIQRLFDAINTETLALSGYNFFTLNRKLLLTVAGTIATYEILLVQYNTLNSDE